MLKKIVNFFNKPFNCIANRNFYSQFIGVNKLFFDIGANIGFKTGVFRSLDVNVVTVEPQKKCFEILLKKFGKDHRIKLVNKGISDHRGELKIKISSSTSLISTFSDKWQKDGRFNDFVYDGEQTVDVITFDDLVSSYGVPDFAKIDVEGYEYEVISGLTKKIPCISFEFTSEFFADSIKILNHFSSLGFTEFNYGQGEKMKLIYTKWISKADLVRDINSQIESDKNLWGDIYAR
jgi:FkbM family methyltransferase